VDPPGLLLAAAARTCYGLYTVFAKQLVAASPATDLPAFSALSLLLGSLALLPWMINWPASMTPEPDVRHSRGGRDTGRRRLAAGPPYV